MDDIQINGERTMHIDTSCKLYESKNTGIAYKIIGSGKHKGLVLKRNLKKILRKNLSVDHDYARLYAICIFLLIKDDFKFFDSLIICGDEYVPYVKDYLRLLFDEESDYYNKLVISITDLRDLTGDKKIRSYADGKAKAYRKRGLKSLARRQKGVSLNPIEINYGTIKILWREIDEKMKM